MSEKRPLSCSNQDDIVSQKIREAEARGEFKDLPLEGRPLPPDDSPFVPADWRLAFQILKNAHFAPEFVERRRAVEKIRGEMAAAPTEAALRRLATRLALEVDALNRSLLLETQFNLSSLQLPPVDVEAEVSRLRPR